MSDMGQLHVRETRFIDKRGRRFHRSERYTIGYMTMDGYRKVQLLYSPTSERRVVGIHRLVAEAFVRGMADGLEVNHKDGNKENNTPENLEWCTKSENIKHAWRTGIRVCMVRGEANGFAKLTEAKVIRMRERYAAGETVKTVADRFGASIMNTHRVVTGETWKHVGGPICHGRTHTKEDT